MKKKTIVTIVLGATIVAAVAYAVTKISRLECTDCDEDWDECCGSGCEKCSGENCGETIDEEIKADFDKEQIEEPEAAVETPEEKQ